MVISWGYGITRLINHYIYIKPRVILRSVYIRVLTCIALPSSMYQIACKHVCVPVKISILGLRLGLTISIRMCNNIRAQLIIIVMMMTCKEEQ